MNMWSLLAGLHQLQLDHSGSMSRISASQTPWKCLLRLALARPVLTTARLRRVVTRRRTSAYSADAVDADGWSLALFSPPCSFGSGRNSMRYVKELAESDPSEKYQRLEPRTDQRVAHSLHY